MGVFCCCYEEYSDTSIQTYTDDRRYGTVSSLRSGPSPCNICGLLIDGAILDGHQETCRSQHRKKMRTEDLPPVPILKGNGEVVYVHNRSTSEEDRNTICVICLENPRAYAFIPCGHLMACLECVKSLTECPICRQVMKGLLFVDPSVNKIHECKHCKNAICPTFFDAHRETCALNQRLLKQNDEEEQEKTYSSLNHSIDLYSDIVPHKPSYDSSSPVSSNLCLECHKAPQVLALLPCGHRCFCVACGEGVHTCPICLDNVEGVLITYT